MNVGISTGRLRRRDLNVEILIGKADEREQRVGALRHGARDAGRGPCGGVRRQERGAARQAVDFIAVDEEGMQDVSLRLAGGGVEAGDSGRQRGRHV